MDHFLAKPFTHEQLMAVLQPIAEQRGTFVVAAPRPAPAAPRKPAPAAMVPPAAPAVQPVTPAASPTTPQVADDTDTPLLSDTVVLGILEVPMLDEDSSGTPVLDASQVSAIRGLGKPKVFEQLCELLFANAPETLKRLDAALEEGDLAAAAQAAHSLKSPVSSLGGRRLAEQLERCETCAREQGDPKAARNAARGLRRTYAELEEALRAETRRGTGT
jgi:HPt (histidine-containing phosphotransfer) domain-containing protein